MLTFDEIWEKLLAGDESVSIGVERDIAAAGEQTC